MKTALLDTNILIAFEDTGRTMLERDAEIVRKARSSIAFYVHPRQIEDIEQDNNEQRRAIMLSRIKQYEMLVNPPDMTEELIDVYGWSTKNRNDEVDNSLLVCVAKPVVNYLITEDKGIIRKAEQSELADRVLSLADLGSLVGVGAEEPELACVVHQPCHCLSIRDPFFDSLRNDYGETAFDKWFIEKCSLGQRKCWAVYRHGQLGALCIYKIENGEVVDDGGLRPCGPVLKLCTFKVDEALRGSKVGERLLFSAFNYGRTHNISFTYFTVKEKKQPHLVELALSFGFQRFGKNGCDRVIGKYLQPQGEDDYDLPKYSFLQKYYPSYKAGPDVSKFLVPIRPQYHERLFPDSSDFRNTILGDMPEMYTSESNTIRKAYICKSAISRMKPGDLLLFYRTADRHSVEVLGAVIEAARLSDVGKILSMVGSRTVYSSLEIEEMLRTSSSGFLLVICFDLIGYLGNPIGRGHLSSLGIQPPQSIMQLPDDVFKSIIEEGR